MRPNFNPRDPLLKTGPEQGRALFDAFNEAARGHDRSVIIDAAVNVLVNVIRQDSASRGQAEAKYDELVGKTKGLLMGHYDSVTGKRRSIFPFTQHVQAAHVLDKDH